MKVVLKLNEVKYFYWKSVLKRKTPFKHMKRGDTIDTIYRVFEDLVITAKLCNGRSPYIDLIWYDRRKGYPGEEGARAFHSLPIELEVRRGLSVFVKEEGA